MKVEIDISIADDRLTARTPDGIVWLDEPALVALTPSRRSPTGMAIVAIGSDARSEPEATAIVPAFSTSDFDPGVTAGVVEWAAKSAWSRQRPQLKGFVAALDRVEVRVEIDGYGDLSPDDRKNLLDHWPYHPQMHWWLAGQKVPE